MKIDDTTIRELQRTLGRTSTGAAVVASNLANVDTPGYRAMRARFPTLLEGAESLRAERTHPAHVTATPDSPASGATLVEAPGTRTRLDGNTVDLDREMTALAMLQGRFSAAAQMVRRRFAILRYTVTDGRG